MNCVNGSNYGTIYGIYTVGYSASLLRFYHSLSAKETAKKGVSYANVRFLQHRALQKLRTVLERMEFFENFRKIL